jgi:site-specific DNA-methyltransferase (adenine-specific)
VTFEIRQGDALELLRDIEPWSIDAIVTDPPYGERVASWDAPRDHVWHLEWLLAADRVLKPNAPIIAFASRRHLDVLMAALRQVRGDDPPCPLQTGAWIHRQGHPSGRPGYLRPEHEPYIVSGLLRTTAEDVRALRQYGSTHNIQRKTTHRRATSRAFKPCTYTPNDVGPMAGTIIEASRNKGTEAVGHPTQKPEAVMDYLVRLACAPGALVLDPFCGSGTTGVVALRTGRRFIGLERDPEYVAMARRRIAGPLFVDQAEEAPTS